MQNDFRIWRKKLLILPGGFLVIYTVSLFLSLIVLSPDSQIYKFVYHFIHEGISAPGMLIIKEYYGTDVSYSYPLTYLALPVNLLVLLIASFLFFSDNKKAKGTGLVVLTLLIIIILSYGFLNMIFSSDSSFCC